METIRDLNMDTDDMQVVLSAIHSVNRRIKEVAQTHKPLFGGEHLARLSRQKDYSLHAVCREDTL